MKTITPIKVANFEMRSNMSVELSCVNKVWVYPVSVGKGVSGSSFSFNHAGPSNHKVQFLSFWALIPREAGSAGFSEDFT